MKKYNLLQWQCLPSKVIARVYSLILMLIIIFSVINIRLFSLSLTSDASNKQENFISYYRKDIVDRNGFLIATSIPTYSVFAHPHLIFNPKQVSSKLFKILKTNKNKLASKLSSNQRFLWLAKDLNPIQMQQINNLGIPGINFEKNFKRIYSYGNLLSHVLGYVSSDNKGLAGLERFYDETLLSGARGELEDTKLELSIDVGIQNIVSEELDKAIEEFDAQGGVGVVIDPNNGQILSLVSKPDFNPHYPGKVNSEALFNKASLGLYEFGSVFKILTMAIAMETRTIKDLNQQYDISYFKVGRHEINDYSSSQGLYSVAEIFARSSNKGTGKIALATGQEALRNYLQRLKLHQRCKTEISETATPIFPSSNHWSDISTVTISYGYGIATSVLNLLQAIVPTVNGGIFYPLTLTKKETEGERIFSPKTSANIKNLLRLVVTNGTGKKANVNGYLVGGKSGTANKLQGKQYSKTSRISNFVSIFPYSNPKYLVYVMLDDPKPNKTHKITTGGANAALAVSKIISRVVAFQGILPYDNDISLPSGVQLTHLNQ